MSEAESRAGAPRSVSPRAAEIGAHKVTGVWVPRWDASGRSARRPHAWGAGKRWRCQCSLLENESGSSLPRYCPTPRIYKAQSLACLSDGFLT